MNIIFINLEIAPNPIRLASQHTALKILEILLRSLISVT